MRFVMVPWREIIAHVSDHLEMGNWLSQKSKWMCARGICFERACDAASFRKRWLTIAK